MKKNIFRKLVIFLGLLLLVGCSDVQVQQPPIFSAQKARWSSVQLRPNMKKNQIWDRLISVITTDFNTSFETTEKEIGFLRSNYFDYSNLQTRISAKLENKNILKLKVDAQHFNEQTSQWNTGSTPRYDRGIKNYIIKRVTSN